jgi:PAS domain S-box-containing protein
MRQARAFLIPLAMVAAATLARVAIDPILHGRSPLVVYVFAIVVSAWQSGLSGGLFATALSLVAGTRLYLAPASNGHEAAAVTQLAVFVIVAVAVSWLTEHARAGQREIALREERFRSLVDATTSIVWTANRAGAFVERQPSWEAYTGQPWEAHRGEGWAGAVHADDRLALRREWDRAIERRAPLETEARLWHAASRAHRAFLVRAVPIFTRSGAVREWIGACTDVDDQRRAEASLRQQEQERDRLLAELRRERSLLQAVLQQIPAGVMITDAEGTLVQVSEQARQLTGVDLTRSMPLSEYTAGTGLTSSHRGNARTEDDWPLVRALRHGERVQDEEVDVTRADGGQRTLMVSAGPVRDDRGRVIAAVTTFYDVTDRKRVEAERERAL